MMHDSASTNGCTSSLTDNIDTAMTPNISNKIGDWSSSKKYFTLFVE